MGNKHNEQSMSENKQTSSSLRKRVRSEGNHNEALESAHDISMINDDSMSNTEHHPEHSERRSSRTIRRKKFDDEVIDNSSLYPKKKFRTLSESYLNPLTYKEEISKNDVKEILPEIGMPEQVMMKAIVESESAESSENIFETDYDNIPPDDMLITERSEKSEFPQPYMFENINYFWTPQDDLILIINMKQSCDPFKVYEHAKFTQNFTLQEVIDRWFLLLYDRVTSNISIESIRQLHKSIISSIERASIFSFEEDSILKQVPSNVRFSYQNFQKILSNNSNIFLSSREPEDLFKRWAYFHSNHLLNDQYTLRDTKLSILNNVPKIHYKNSTFSIEELEERQICLKRLLDSKIHEFRILQAEINQLTILASTISGVNAMEFDSDVYAYLRGSRVRYMIKTKEVTLGRSTKDIIVDCDLTREGFSKRISRFQAVINLLPIGRFLIFNAGSHHFTVDSTVVQSEEAAELLDESLVQFDDLSFLFRINRPLIIREFRLYEAIDNQTNSKNLKSDLRRVI